MANINQLENGKWKAVVEVGPPGKRKRRTKTKDTKKEAEAWMASMITEKNQGTMVDPDSITVSQWFERFLEQKKPNIAVTTYDMYVKRYEAHIKPDMGYMRLQDVQPFHVEEYLAEKRRNGRIDGKGGLSENTLKKIYVLLNQGFKKAKKFHLIKQNPLDPIEPPKPEKVETDVMYEEEFLKLLKTAKEYDFFMFTFICTDLYTGMRKSEILGLDWTKIDFNNNIIKVRQRLVQKRGAGAVIEEETKNSPSRRDILISDKLCNLLKQYRKWQLEMRLALGEDYRGDDFKGKPIELVFCKTNGERYYPTSLNKKMRQLMKKAKLPYKSQIHILRHTFATINVNSKIGPEIVQKMLGHSTIKTTIDIYYHHKTEQQKEAVDNLDNIININI